MGAAINDFYRFGGVPAGLELPVTAAVIALFVIVNVVLIVRERRRRLGK